jgi:release factor glutamine methyltransferase
VLSDISGKAVLVAYLNQQVCDYDEMKGTEIFTVESDLFAELEKDGEPIMTFDLIVCNPPYIKTAEIGAADKYVLREPRIALDGGADGLSFYRRILRDAKRFLSQNGTIMFEIGSDQAAEVTQIVKENGFNGAEIVKDLANRDRVVIFHF